MKSDELTVAGIHSALKRASDEREDYWLPDGSGRGSGRLLLRATPSGGHWYFRYTRPDGKRDTLSIGPYARPGRTKTENTGAAYSLAEARTRARDWAALLKHPQTSDIRAHFDAEARALAIQAQRASNADSEAESIAEARSRTLARLCSIYCDHLQAQGKVSASKVRSDLTRHVLASPLAERPARELRRSELASLIRGLVEAGKSRTAGMVRTYLAAAYTLAMTAEGDATAPAALIAFEIDANPMAGIKAIPVAERQRVLKPEELRAFLSRLDAQMDITRDALLMALLAGGQRPMQLLRAEVSDYEREHGVLTLQDGKGRRRTARQHALPLASRGRELAERLLARASSLQSRWLFSSLGTLPTDVGTLSWRVTEISRAMMAAGESAEPFQMKDLRRTVETMLAGMRVSKDLRAQLLSHGLSGVQTRNYDRHEYFDEKRGVLEQWEARLADIQSVRTAKVIPFPSRRP